MKKKILIMMMALTISFSAACGNPKTTTTELPKNKAESTEKKKESGQEDAPGIKGSQVYDILISLEKNGIPKAETITTDDGFQYNSSNGLYSYSISTNKAHEIMSATFSVLNGTDNEGFLQFCASMPYDNADSETASTWVTSNIGVETNTTIGHAIFILSNGQQGPILTIKSLEFDNYVLSKATK